jgi:hypothetical protein
MSTTPLGQYDPIGGFRIDGNVTQFWAKRTQAVEAARALGYPIKNVVMCHTRFQIGYTIMLAPLAGLLSKENYNAGVADHSKS